jgi:hypothetical protein
MAGLVRKLEANALKQERRYTSNDELEASLAPMSMLKDGLSMTLANWANAVLPSEKVITLPL